MERVLKKVLKKITPSDADRERFCRILEKIEKSTDTVIKPLGLEKTIAGSFIRDTWLADKKEMDMFIMFDTSVSRERLEKVGLSVGKKIIGRLGGRYEIAYAEHPYVRGVVGGFSVDIVPCYKVASASKIKSAVDRTPFHNKYMIENLKPEMAGEVRLAKQFCKAMDVYGSDVRTLGFSGYLCELLIIKYGNFKKLVKAAARWKPGFLIDLENHCNFSSTSDQFRGQPLIVIDPTDPKRNVAAALSHENFNKFIAASGKFVDRPSLKFFEIDRVPLKAGDMKKRMAKRKTEMFAVEFARPGVVDDILWSQMRKTSFRIARLLSENGFEVFEQFVWSDSKKAYIIFEMKRWNLPENVRIIGPPVSSEKHSDEFKKKYGSSGIYSENGRWVATTKRKCREVEVLLRGFLKSRKKTLLQEGVRSYVAEGISGGFRLLKSDDLAKTAQRNEEFSIFVKKYFERAA
jgi:tRNA nucleotidyltransferase (CCA-adding enzyme)